MSYTESECIGHWDRDIKPNKPMEEKSFWKKQLDNQFKYLNKMFDANDTSDRYQKQLCSAIGQLLYFKSKVEEKPEEVLEKKQYEWLLNHRKKEKPIGHVYYPTTVDEMNGGCDFFNLWKNAPTETNRSDVKTFFQPAYIREVERLKKEKTDHNKRVPMGLLMLLKGAVDEGQTIVDEIGNFITLSEGVYFWNNNSISGGWEQAVRDYISKSKGWRIKPKSDPNEALKAAVDSGHTIVDDEGSTARLVKSHPRNIYKFTPKDVGSFLCYSWEELVERYLGESNGWEIKKGLNN